MADDDIKIEILQSSDEVIDLTNLDLEERIEILEPIIELIDEERVIDLTKSIELLDKGIEDLIEISIEPSDESIYCVFKIIEELWALYYKLLLDPKISRTKLVLLKQQIEALENDFASNQYFQRLKDDKNEKVEIKEEEVKNNPPNQISDEDKVETSYHELKNVIKPFIQNTLELLSNENKLQTPINIEHHHKQKYIGAPKSTCTIASLRNAMEHFQIIGDKMDDDKLIKDYKLEEGTNLWTENGYVHSSAILEAILHQKLDPLKGEASTTFFDIFATLIGGGLVLSSNRGHTVLISGIEQQGNRFFFRVNDPLTDRVDRWELDDERILRRLIATKGNISVHI